MGTHTSQHVGNGGLSRAHAVGYRVRRTPRGLWLVERVQRSATGRLCVRLAGYFATEREAKAIARGLNATETA